MWKVMRASQWITCRAWIRVWARIGNHDGLEYLHDAEQVALEELLLADPAGETLVEVLHDNVDGREHHARHFVEEGEGVLAGIMIHTLANQVEQREVGVVHDTSAQIAGDVERAKGLRVQLVALA